MDFFEKRGLKLKTERQSRVFPASDRSDAVLESLKKELVSNGVKILYDSPVEDIVIEAGEVKKIILAGGIRLSCKAVILATGGITYAHTGSTGDGLRIARKSGHKITETRPALVPLITKERYPASLKGLTLKNIRLVFTDGRRKIVSDVGEMLFTHFGVSGPLVLTLSGQVVDWLRERRKVYVEIDLKPALSEEKLDSRILREISSSPKKTAKNMLKSFLPVRLIEVCLGISKIPPDRIVSHITQAERKRLVSFFKAFRLNISGSMPMDTAMVTRGGVSLGDINPRTMGSRVVKGLYFAGEIIDVDADTGGFNLQAAFSTGYLAGQSSAENIKKGIAGKVDTERRRYVGR
jgi:hypothetical protein